MRRFRNRCGCAASPYQHVNKPWFWYVLPEAETLTHFCTRRLSVDESSDMASVRAVRPSVSIPSAADTVEDHRRALREVHIRLNILNILILINPSRWDVW